MRDSDAHLLKPGSIVQIDPADRWALDNMCAGELAVVVSVETWGVIGLLDLAPHSQATWRLSFALIESTGGAIIWGRDGKRISNSPPAPRHHP